MNSETKKFNHLSKIFKNFISEFEDSNREGLINTPERVSKMYIELLSGYKLDIEKLLNNAIFNSDNEDMIVVKDIEFFSLCEHHIIPFFGSAHVAYIPKGKIIGLSKIPKLVQALSKKLQVQENLTSEISKTLNDILLPQGVGVVLKGTHLCTMMRGVKSLKSSLITSSMLGSFRKNMNTRQEFLNLIEK
ncbi:MAG: GTP cyclohydrolase I FolE [Chloroflexi bacterium]|nr:GTP cyclohydrolase I FolE [Chloroflexota bacterium]|tara:strand:+ start:1476 stop:2045 length:570 start_codon:yes stop_codon:yes gene_type:complete